MNYKNIDFYYYYNNDKSKISKKMWSSKYKNIWYQNMERWNWWVLFSNPKENSGIKLFERFYIKKNIYFAFIFLHDFCRALNKKSDKLKFCFIKIFKKILIKSFKKFVVTLFK